MENFKKEKCRRRCSWGMWPIFCSIISPCNNLRSGGRFRTQMPIDNYWYSTRTQQTDINTKCIQTTKRTRHEMSYICHNMKSSKVWGPRANVLHEHREGTQRSRRKSKFRIVHRKVQRTQRSGPSAGRLRAGARVRQDPGVDGPKGSSTPTKPAGVCGGARVFTGLLYMSRTWKTHLYDFLVGEI